MIAPLFHDPGAAPSRPRVLIVDDEPGIRTVLAQVLGSTEYELREAADGREALEIFAREGADAILSDLMMPLVDGLELLRSIRAIDETVAFIMLTGAGTLENAIEALRHDADDYLLKPFNIDEVTLSLGRALRHRQLLRQSRQYQQMLELRVGEQAERLEQLFVDGLLTLSNAVEARDRYTGGHVERVTLYAVATGATLGLTEAELRPLAVAGLLHDIGKLSVPDAVLSKPGRLTQEEYALMQQHPATGAAIVERSLFLREAASGVLHHHERWDGGGYPLGLAGERISLSGRILAVVDAFDAMVTNRPYRSMQSVEAAVVELNRCAGDQFDPSVVEAFSMALQEGFSRGADLPYVAAVRERTAATDLRLPTAGQASISAVPLVGLTPC